MAVIKKITEGKMNCNRARSLLNSYIDNKLDLRTAYQLAVHVESCSRCREELETSYIRPLLRWKALMMLRLIISGP